MKNIERTFKLVQRLMREEKKRQADEFNDFIKSLIEMEKVKDEVFKNIMDRLYEETNASKANSKVKNFHDYKPTTKKTKIF